MKWSFQYLPNHSPSEKYESFIKEIHPMICSRKEKELIKTFEHFDKDQIKYLPLYRVHDCEYYMSILNNALNSRCFKFANLLITHSDVKMCDEAGRTPIRYILGNDISDQYNLIKSLIKNLVDRGSDINNKEKEYGETVLHYALKWYDNELVKILVDQGADVNIQDEDGETALHYAVRFKDGETVKFLIDHGAHIHIQNKDGNTALDLAIYLDNQDMVNIQEFRGYLTKRAK